MVIIRELEPYKYSDSTIYRLELSNMTYIIDKSELRKLYKMIKYIANKYDIINYSGKSVEELLNCKFNDLEFVRDNYLMSTENYIDFVMTKSEHRSFMVKFTEELDILVSLMVEHLGLLVTSKYIPSLVQERIGTRMTCTIAYEYNVVFLYISDNTLFFVNMDEVYGYLYSVLHIHNYDKFFDTGCGRMRMIINERYQYKYNDYVEYLRQRYGTSVNDALGQIFFDSSDYLFSIENEDSLSSLNDDNLFDFTTRESTVRGTRVRGVTHSINTDLPIGYRTLDEFMNITLPP